MEKCEYSYYSDDLMCHHNITFNPEQSTFPMHAHDMYEIFYFINGNVSYLVEGTEYKLKSGDVIIARPSETHRLLVKDSSYPYERFALNFSGSVLSKEECELLTPFLSRPLGKQNLYKKENFRSDYYKSIIESMYAKTSSKIEKRLILHSELITFLIELKLAFEFSVEPQQKASEEISEEIISYVNSHLFDDISLKGLSEKYYLSMTHLNRTFKSLTGSTLWNYVKIKRLIAAREEIRSGTPVSIAARKCGYNDYSSFFRAYVDRFGTNPNSDR